MIRKIHKPLIAFIMAITVIGASVASFPSQVFADDRKVAGFSGNVSLEDFLYVTVAYRCMLADSGNQLMQSISLSGSQKISDIITIGAYGSGTYVGKYIGNDNGYIYCKTAFDKVFGTTGITSDTINNGVLKGVYTADEQKHYKTSCSYPILNGQNVGENDFIGANTGNIQYFNWPEGYLDDGANGGAGTAKFGADAGTINIIYTPESGVKDIEWNQPSGTISKSVILENIKTFWSGADAYSDLGLRKACQKVVDSVRIYEGSNLKLQSIYRYRKLNQAYIGINEDNVGSDGIHYAPVVEVGTQGVSAELGPSVQSHSAFLQNILDEYFGSGYSSPEDYYNSHPELQYTLLGRYLYNGDGKFSAGCNGTSSIYQEDLEKANDDEKREWGKSGIVSSSAYEKNSGVKKNFLTYYPDGENVALNYSPFPWGDGYGALCEDIRSQFNSITTTNVKAKNLVYGYINPKHLGDSETPVLPGGTDPTNPDNPESSEEPKAEADCYNSAESLGWILCPALKLGSDILDALYTTVFEHFLQINTNILSLSQNDEENDGDEAKIDAAREASNCEENENGELVCIHPTFAAWQSFQTFANIVFVILLLIIIISQLTGIGIDNLGIKRILPRLVVAFILVNLSYILCLLAVDVSNIAGKSIHNLFNAMSNNVPVLDPVITGGEAVQGVGGGLLTLILAAITVGGFWIAYGGIAGMILAIFPVIVSGVVSLLFTLILLGARQAGVVILTVISPVAIALYMLPNTKKFFDRWIKMFSGLLLLYPIVGALVGGSNFASALLLSSANASNMNQGILGFFFLLTAMLINIVPYFFIPTLLRGSFAAIGNLGNRIGQIGRNLGGRASGAIRRSEGYQQKRDLARSGLSLFRRDENGNPVQSRMPSQRLRRRVASGNGVLGRLVGRSTARTMARAEDNALKTDIATDRARQQLGLGVAADNFEMPERVEGETDAQYERRVRDARRNAATAAGNAYIAGTVMSGHAGNIDQVAQTSNYADATFANAVIQRNQLRNESTQKETMLYGEDDYVKGKRRQADLNIAMESEKTSRMADDKLFTGAVNAQHTDLYRTRRSMERLSETNVLEDNLAAIDADEKEKVIKATQSSILNSAAYATKDFKMGAGHQIYEMLDKYVKNGNAEEIAAMVNVLSGDDHGRDLLHNYLTEHSTTMSQDTTGNGRRSLDHIAAAIANNGNSWKTGDRAIKNWAEKREANEDISRFAYGADVSIPLEKLSPNELAGIDDGRYAEILAAINGDADNVGSLASSLRSGRITQEQYSTAIESYKSTAQQALRNADAGRLNLQRAQRNFLQAIVDGKNTVPPLAASAQQTVMSTQQGQETTTEQTDGSEQQSESTSEQQGTFEQQVSHESGQSAQPHNLENQDSGSFMPLRPTVNVANLTAPMSSSQRNTITQMLASTNNDGGITEEIRSNYQETARQALIQGSYDQDTTVFLRQVAGYESNSANSTHETLIQSSQSNGGDISEIPSTNNAAGGEPTLTSPVVLEPELQNAVIGNINTSEPELQNNINVEGNPQEADLAETQQSASPQTSTQQTADVPPEIIDIEARTINPINSSLNVTQQTNSGTTVRNLRDRLNWIPGRLANNDSVPAAGSTANILNPMQINDMTGGSGEHPNNTQAPVPGGLPHPAPQNHPQAPGVNPVNPPAGGAPGTLLGGVPPQP